MHETSEWNVVLGKPPRDWAELQPPKPLLPVSATLIGATDFTMAPQAAATMTQHGALMTHASPHLVLEQVLHERGFRGWWQPVDRLLGTVSVLGTDVSWWRPIPGTALLKDACILLLNIHRPGIGEKSVSCSSVLIHYKGWWERFSAPLSSVVATQGLPPCRLYSVHCFC